MKTRASYLRLLIVLLALLPISCKEVGPNSPEASNSGGTGAGNIEQCPSSSVSGWREKSTSVTEVIQSPCGCPPEESDVQFISELTGEIQPTYLFTDLEGILKDPSHDCAPFDLSVAAWPKLTVLGVGDPATLDHSIKIFADISEDETIMLYWQTSGCIENEACRISYHPEAGLEFYGAASYFSRPASGKVTITHLKMDPKAGESYEVSGRFEFEFPEGRVTGSFSHAVPYYSQVP